MRVLPWFVLCVSLSSAIATAPRAAETAPAAISESPSLIQGRTLDEWREVMKSLDLKSPEAATEVPGLLEIVSDDRVPWFTRRQAALTLGRIGAPAARAIPLLEQYAAAPARSDDTSASLWAVKSLALYGRVAAPATPTLARLVTDSATDPAIRLMSVEALCRIGTAHPLALATVVNLLRSHEPCLSPEQRRTGAERELVVACIESLELFQGDAESSVPILLRYSEDREDRVRRAVAVTLGAIGPRASDAGPRLAVMTLSDRSHDVRDVAAIALGKIGGTEWLVRILSHSDPDTRERAATALGFVPGRDVATKSALANARADESPLVRISAIEATERWHSDPQLTAPAAAQELAAPDRHVRIRAVRFLTKLGLKAAPAIPILEQLRNHAELQVRQSADKLLESIEAQGLK